MANLKNLIKQYDCFAWLPTVRGALSLELLENPENILGDVDKYVARIKRYVGMNSEHYIAATSMLTVNDSKAGSKYSRTFRFIFTGDINVRTEYEELLQNLNIEDEEIHQYFINDGVLLGQLIIINETTERLENNEVRILEAMIELSNECEEYKKMFYINAASMETLESFRNNMVEKWKSIKNIVQEIKNVTTGKPIFSFNVLLTRDGIMLLKDTTNNQYKTLYTQENTATDYTRNIPLHRLFKVAMNYVKYLFHTNYHHNEEHDTFLPASNLHPYRQGEENMMTGIFRHQMNAFMNPIGKLKRNRFKDYPIDANGIMIYASAFINVFRNNNLISKDTADKTEEFLKTQKQEIEHMLIHKKSLVNSIIAQNNIIFIGSGILAFIVAIITILNTFTEFEKIKLDNIDYRLLTYYATLFWSLAIVGFLIYIIPHKRILNNQFKSKMPKHNFLFANSNLRKAQFAWQYSLYIEISTLIVKLKKKRYNIIQLCISVIGLIIVLSLAYFIINFLISN